MDQAQVSDIVEIQQVLGKYAVYMTQDDVEKMMTEVFTPDGTYSAFGSTYGLHDFPSLVASAPKGLFLVGTPVIELDGDTGTGQQWSLWNYVVCCPPTWWSSGMQLPFRPR